MQGQFTAAVDAAFTQALFDLPPILCSSYRLLLNGFLTFFSLEAGLIAFGGIRPFHISTFSHFEPPLFYSTANPPSKNAINGSV